MENKLLKIKDIADVLGVTKQTVYKIIKKHNIPNYKIESVIRVKQEDFDKYLKEVQAIHTQPLQKIN